MHPLLGLDIHKDTQNLYQTSASSYNAVAAQNGRTYWLSACFHRSQLVRWCLQNLFAAEIDAGEKEFSASCIYACSGVGKLGAKMG